MGAACCRQDSAHVEPTIEIFIDKLIKYIITPILIVLGFVGLVILYLVDKIKCYPKGSTVDQRNPKAEEYCWSEFTAAVNDGTYWRNTDFLPHKIYPIVLICQGLSLLLPLLLWYWCFGRELSDCVSSVINHSNNLTECYRKYDRGKGRTITEVILHRELDNCLEYMAYLFITQVKRIYRLFFAKWVSLIILSFLWIAGLVLLHFPTFVIFHKKFACVYDTVHGTQKVAECSIPPATLLTATWYVNVTMMLFLVIVNIAYIVSLRQPSQYTNTFMYRSIPGCQDKRLAVCIQQFFNSRHVYLISKFCNQNSYLCHDVGLSRSLARKYGLFNCKTPAGGLDRHFPIIQNQHIHKFKLSAEMFHLNIYREVSSISQTQVANSSSNKEIKKSTIKRIKKNTSSKVKPKLREGNDERKERKKNSYFPAHSVKTKFHEENEERKFKDTTAYFPAHSLRRKIKRETKHLKSVIPRAGDSIPTSESPPTKRSVKSDITLEDLEFITSTPTKPNKESKSHQAASRFKNTSRSNKLNDSRTNQYPRIAMHHRELDPYAFRLHKTIMRRKAVDAGEWKP